MNLFKKSNKVCVKLRDNDGIIDVFRGNLGDTSTRIVATWIIFVSLEHQALE